MLRLKELKFLSTLSLRRATCIIDIINNIIDNFYPRSPCGERPCTTTITICTALFLSTLSLRRATVGAISQLQCVLDFYPRSPCGERQARRDSRQHPAGISIHALLAESDNINGSVTTSDAEFLSTLSLRRATGILSIPIIGFSGFLSTLSLRRATRGGHISKARSKYFYPRSPCGERHNGHETTPYRVPISIHALLAESDGSNQSIISQADDFYPRSPCGERHTS